MYPKGEHHAVLNDVQTTKQKQEEKKNTHTLDPEDKSLTSLIDNSGLLSDATADPLTLLEQLTHSSSHQVRSPCNIKMTRE